jgi:hypothetical protein
MTSRLTLLLISCCFPLVLVAQTISGYVFDESSGEPLESVAVYFDNTTLGTTTNAEGFFSLDYTEAITSTLVFSYLGYQVHYMADYRNKSEVSMALQVRIDELEEVVIDYDDGLTRKQKLQLFRQEFLGKSAYAKSCKILNEQDIVLRYNKTNKTLLASASKPVVILNKKLNYQISYDIIDFEVQYKYLDFRDDYIRANSVIYQGTSFFRDLNKKNRKRDILTRDRVYRGSVQHFMRSIFNQQLSEEKFDIYVNSFLVNPWEYIVVSPSENPDFKKVELKNKINILYNKARQSELQLAVSAFYIDKYGNYLPIQGVLFSGVMGDQRIGDILPSDYAYADPKN